MTIGHNVGFVGGGQMAEALIQGLIARGLVSPGQLVASDPSQERRHHLRETFGIEVTTENLDVISASQLILLAVKPQIMPAALASIAPAVTGEHLVISIAAGVTLDTLETGLPTGTRVVRVMPNTPALVQAGASALSPGRAVLAGDVDLVQRIFRAVGVAVVVPEAMLDAVTGLSGSGPAYVFSFLAGLIDAGVREGLPRPIARELVLQTLLGSVLLCRETGRHPGELIDMVTSPGGTTMAGLHALERGAFRGLLMDAVRAATQRSRELGAS
jgi:pyrroline-5-carboxylate reductase